MPTVKRNNATQRGTMPTCLFNDTLPLLSEVLRFRAAIAVQHELEKLCREHLHASACDAKGLLPAAVFEGQQHAAVRATTAAAASRTWVHPILDVRRRASVQIAGESANEASAVYRLLGVQYVKGAILGVLEPLLKDDASTAAAAAAQTNSSGTAAPHMAPLTDLRLCNPEPFYDDALLPTLEGIQPHHASKNLLDLWLNKLCGASDKLDSSYNQKRKKAWHLADEATHVFFVARKRLAQQLSFLAEHAKDSTPLCSVRVSLQTADAVLLDVLSLSSSRAEATTVMVDIVWNAESTTSPVRSWIVPDAPASCGPSSKSDHDGEVVWQTHEATSMTRLLLPISPAAVLRLYSRYTRAAAVASPSQSGREPANSFLHSLALLLLRYQGLSGGQMEKESGWQAAVPSLVVDAFEHFAMAGVESGAVVDNAVSLRSFTVECFASPFNATRRFFFSVFHDTDAAFGSLGNFFACRDAQTCVKAIYTSLRECVPATLNDGLTSPGASPTLLLRLECNPPFDHEVIAAAFAQLLRWLQGAANSMAVSVLIIIPDSTQAHATAVRASVEASPLCRWVRSMPPATCLYLHGAQQHQPQIAASASSSTPGHMSGGKRPREVVDVTAQADTSQLIQLSCPTRLLVVQDDDAEKLCSGAALGSEIHSVWCGVSRGH